MTNKLASRVDRLIASGARCANNNKDYIKKLKTMGNATGPSTSLRSIIRSYKALSDPIRDETVQTTGGYWLIEVLEKDSNRTVEEQHRDKIISSLLNDAFSQLIEDSKERVESYLDDKKKSWALERVITEKK